MENYAAEFFFKVIAILLIFGGLKYYSETEDFWGTIIGGVILIGGAWMLFHGYWLTLVAIIIVLVVAFLWWVR